MTSLLASDRDLAVIETVTRFTQARSDQLIRLHFRDLTPDGRRVVANRTLRRLCKWGYLIRIPHREVGAAGGGSTGYVYTTPRNKERIDHQALAIAELFVNLSTLHEIPLTFRPEAHAYQPICDISLEPDAELIIRTPTSPPNKTNWWFLEIDRSTESRSRIMEKLVRYSRAYDEEHPNYSGFPAILFIVDHPRGPQRALERVKEIRRWIEVSPTPKLFKACTFSEAVNILTD